ncbi:MAG: recombination-associated protein RdgC, partial [Desulfuromonadales bacterium]|nr:recombination-associated protein RdgC [Desulfuromonadales bacterium]
MGILANTVSICQFQVVGELAAPITFDWVQERLGQHRFRCIEKSTEELSIGWVHLDDPRASGFEAPHDFWRDHYLAFSLRRDQRRIPGALLRAHLQQAEQEFIAAHPGMQKVPKGKREELREAVRGSLLARLLPTPTVYDAVWDTRRGVLTLATLNPKVSEMFEDLFRASFDGLRLVTIHPFSRAEKVVGEELRPALQQANRANGDAVLEMIRDNQWLGEDFFLWLLHRTLEGSAQGLIAVEGPA